MRIRSVKPEFWKDEVIASLPYPVRLLYIGLWNCADDAGFLEWRPARLGADLFPYEPAARRERNIAEWGAKLVVAERLRLYEHCRCAEIPTLPVHQKAGGRPSYQYRDGHVAHSTDQSVSVRDDKPVDVDGREGKGEGEDAREALPSSFAVTDPVVAYMRLTGAGRPVAFIETKIRANAERYGLDEWMFAVNQAREMYGVRNDITNAERIAEEAWVARKAQAEASRKADIAATRITPEQAERQRRFIAEQIARKPA